MMAKKYDWLTHSTENSARYWSDQFNTEAAARYWSDRFNTEAAARWWVEHNAKSPASPTLGTDQKGWIYVMSNPAMPRLVKIGYSMSDPSERAAELYTSGVPLPNVVEFELRVDTPSRLEAHAHERLRHCRVNSRREWFRCSVMDAVTAIGAGR